MKKIIAILTDFGLRDHYVGVMKGVMLGINPEVTFVDISHEVPSHSITAVQFLLKASVRYFPHGTIFLVVVDPGVGSDRRAMILKTRNYLFVAPDNGVLTPFFKGDWEAYELPIPSSASNTFHGRDVFAPAASKLSLGTHPSQLGKRFYDPIISKFAEPVRTDEGIRGEIIYIDKFGNLVTNIPSELVNNVPALRIRLKNATIHGLKRSYMDVGRGEPLALVGSSEFLEISVREGSAAEYLNAHVGDEVEVVFK